MSYPFTLPAMTREAIENQIEVLIAFLDALDGDPDCDEDDAEDAFGFSMIATCYYLDDGPGCAISDPGGGNCEDERSAQPPMLN